MACFLTTFTSLYMHSGASLRYSRVVSRVVQQHDNRHDNEARIVHSLWFKLLPLC